MAQAPREMLGFQDPLLVGNFWLYAVGHGDESLCWSSPLFAEGYLEFGLDVASMCFISVMSSSGHLRTHSCSVIFLAS